MKIHWVRSNDEVRYDRPSTTMCLGIRDSGKSSFLETMGERYLERGTGIIDLFGSRDGEGLAWLRSPYAKNSKVLLLRGESVEVKTTGNIECKTIPQLEISDFENYDLIISSSPLYTSMDDEFINAGRIVDKLYKRIHWNRMLCCIVREAANLYYSRLKINDSQIIAKSQMTYLIREARHVGMALTLDSTRWKSIDIDIRSLSDYLVLKSQGITGLERELRWLYRIFQPNSIQNMDKRNFIMITRRGAVGMGSFPEVPWHKQEGEDILQKLGISVEYREEMQQSLDKGTFRTLGDIEHTTLINMYAVEGLGMNQVSAKLNRSSRTVLTHIQEHNKQIAMNGYCPSCRRAKSALDTQRAEKAASTAPTVT